MRSAIAGVIGAFALAQAGAAAECGGPEAPCEIAGGHYHAAAPEGPGPHPAVIFMHGWGGVAARTIANTGLVNRFLARGYAVIAPQGMPRSGGRSGGSWNSFADPERRDDVDFVARAADDAAERFGLDRDRMIASGFSGGGMMAWRIACDAPESFAAYAPIAGLMWRPLPEECRGPVRILHTHGWTDPVVPMEGRSVAGGRITQGDLFVGLNLLRDAAHCARDDPDHVTTEGDYWRRRWTDCDPGGLIEFALHPGGHSVPSGWTELTLDWFEALPMAPDAVCAAEDRAAARC